MATLTAPLAAPASTARPAAPARRWAAASVGAACLVPVAVFLVLFPLVTAMPTWDQWSMAEVWIAHFDGKPVLPLLLQPYNGHRNVLPRFFFYGLGTITGWNVRVEVLASYLAAAATLALLLRMCARQGRALLLLALPVAVHVFSLLQYENFLSGYPFGQNLSQLLATTVVFLLTRPVLSTRAFTGAALAATGATFSWGAGLAAFPVGLVALLLRGERRPARLGVWAVLTALAVAVIRQQASSHFGPVPWTRLPRFYLVLLGKACSPFAMPSQRLTMALGALALATFTVAGIWAYRRLRASSLPWIVLGLSALAAAGLIALGRSAEPLTQALASHYVTATYPLVVACTALLVLLLMDVAARSERWRAAARAAAATVGVAFLLPPLFAASQMLPILRGWDAIVRTNALAIARGTATDVQIRTSHHPVPQLVREGTEVLRAHRLAWFRSAIDGETPHGVVDRLAGQTGDRATFAVEANGPWTIEGWAVRSRHEGGPVRAVVLLVDGRRVAAATLDLPREDVATHFGSTAFRLSGWTMTVPPDAVPPGAHHLTVAVVDFAGGLLPLLEAELAVSEPAAAAAAA